MSGNFREVPRSHQLYRHFDADGRLLYVGISCDVFKRLDSHRRSHWWPVVATVTIEHLGSVTRVEAERIEAAAIAAERPAHNLVRPGYVPPAPTYDLQLLADARGVTRQVLAELLGIDLVTLDQPVDTLTADDYAGRVGLHPSEVWQGWGRRYA